MICNLTEEQAKTVAKKAFGLENIIISELYFKYFSGKYFGGVYKSSDEKVTVTFTARDFKNENNSNIVVVEILPSLDITVSVFDDKKKFKGLLPIKNQHFTQKFFIDNNITPQ